MKKIAIGMKFLCALLTASLIFTSGSVVEASGSEEVITLEAAVDSENNSLDSNTISEADFEYSNLINQEFDTLVAHWGGEYPTYYAGAFIADRQFTILVTCEPQDVQNEIWTITGNRDIIVAKASNSYNDLMNLQDQITELVTNLQSEGDRVANLVVGIGVDEIQNDVFVEVLNMDETVREEVETMLEAYSSVRLVAKDSPYEEMTNVTAGTDKWVVNNNLGTACTIGFCATRVNSAGVTEKGFVTAGHAGNLSNTMKIDGNSVGKISWRKYGGNCDACFVNLNDFPSSGYVMSHILSTNYTITSYSSVGVVGTSYAMHGKSSGIIAGTVDNTSFNFTMGGISFTDHIRMYMHVVNGDSGAPLVRSLTGYNRSVVGICSSGDSTYSNFTKVTNILSSMNGSLY